MSYRDMTDMLGMQPGEKGKKRQPEKKVSKKEQQRKALMEPVADGMKRAVVGKLGKKS
jgi:hypothetical protein